MSRKFKVLMAPFYLWNNFSSRLAVQPRSDSLLQTVRILNSWRRQWWGLLLTLAAMYDAFTVPFILAFSVNHDVVLLALGWLVDVGAWADIVLSFRTTFFSAENEACAPTIRTAATRSTPDASTPPHSFRRACTAAHRRGATDCAPVRPRPAGARCSLVVAA